MLEKQAAWKREGGFDRVKIIPEMHEQTLRRLRVGFDSRSLYTGLPLTSEEFALEMNVEVERLRLEIIISEPPPPLQYNLSSRRSPAVSTGLDKPGVPHTELQQT